MAVAHSATAFNARVPMSTTTMTPCDPAFDAGVLDATLDGAMPLVQYAAAVYDPDDDVEIRKLRGDDAESTWTTAARLWDIYPALLANNDQRWNIHIGVNPRRRSQRGDKAVVLARVVFIDFDGIDVATALEPSHPQCRHAGTYPYCFIRARHPYLLATAPPDRRPAGVATTSARHGQNVRRRRQMQKL